MLDCSNLSGTFTILVRSRDSTISIVLNFVDQWWSFMIRKRLPIQSGLLIPGKFYPYPGNLGLEWRYFPGKRRTVVEWQTGESRNGGDRNSFTIDLFYNQCSYLMCYLVWYFCFWFLYRLLLLIYKCCCYFCCVVIYIFIYFFLSFYIGLSDIAKCILLFYVHVHDLCGVLFDDFLFVILLYWYNYYILMI